MHGPDAPDETGAERTDDAAAADRGGVDPAATDEVPGRAADGEPPAGPSPLPGDRRPPGLLAAPPSQRYANPDETPVVDGDAGASPVRGVIFGALVALFVGTIMVLLGAVLGFTAGLIWAALFLGILTAAGVKGGAGSTLGPTRRAWVSVVLTLAALVLVQLVLWTWARTQGGSLDLPDFLREVYGPIVGIEAILAAVGAWWASR